MRHDYWRVRALIRDWGIPLQKREGVLASGGALKPLPQLGEALAVYFTRMGDVGLSNTGDGVLLGRVPL